jgi:hypothetical protein
MPLPVEQRIRVFVFVIESPSAVDLYHRRNEGEIIRQAVEWNGIKCVVKTAISLQAFSACLKIGLVEEMSLRTGFIPLLHTGNKSRADTNRWNDRPPSVEHVLLKMWDATREDEPRHCAVNEDVRRRRPARRLVERAPIEDLHLRKPFQGESNAVATRRTKGEVQQASVIR